METIDTGLLITTVLVILVNIGSKYYEKHAISRIEFILSYVIRAFSLFALMKLWFKSKMLSQVVDALMNATVTKDDIYFMLFFWVALMALDAWFSYLEYKKKKLNKM